MYSIVCPWSLHKGLTINDLGIGLEETERKKMLMLLLWGNFFLSPVATKFVDSPSLGKKFMEAVAGTISFSTFPPGSSSQIINGRPLILHLYMDVIDACRSCSNMVGFNLSWHAQTCPTYYNCSVIRSTLSFPPTHIRTTWDVHLAHLDQDGMNPWDDSFHFPHLEFEMSLSVWMATPTGHHCNPS